MTDDDRISQEDRELVSKLRASMRRQDTDDADCPSAMDLAAYVDGRARDKAERIEAHLALCPRCLRAVIDARRLIAEPPMPAPKAVLDRAKALRRPAVLRWSVVVRWGAAVAASLLIGLAGLLAGSSLHRARAESEAKLVAEITFQLAAADTGQTTNGDNLFEVLAVQEEAQR